jgi:hypothetical protein
LPEVTSGSKLKAAQNNTGRTPANGIQATTPIRRVIHEIKMKSALSITASLLFTACTQMAPSPDHPAFEEARRSGKVAGLTLSKSQRWLHEVALPKIDPKTNLYISHHRGSGRYREALWNYDDAAADTYPFLFWAAWYTDLEKINGPILDVLKAEQQLCNHIDRIPTAYDHVAGKKVIKSKDDTIFAASEYLKDGLIAIVEVSGPNTPWFERMRGIIDDIWKHADIDTPYGKIPTKNLEANGELIQILSRLFTITGEKKYLEWAERLADTYLLDETFMPSRLRDHGCEIIGGLGLLLGVESVHNPEKAEVYRPRLKRILDEILKRGTNEDGLMYNALDKPGQLNDSWGYNYVTYLCYDMVAGEPVYREHLRKTLQNLAKPEYQDYPWEGKSVDGFADSVEGAIYLLNRIDVPEAVAWTDHEVAQNIIFADQPDRLLTTYKLESNGIRTALQHAIMHTRGLIARPWQQEMTLGASESEDGLHVVIKATNDWSGKLHFDIPRHKVYMGFKHDWPRMNTMPEWFTVELNQKYTVNDLTSGTEKTYSGQELHKGLPLKLQAGQECLLKIK